MSTSAAQLSPTAEASNAAASLRYPDTGTTRDLRFDLMRGCVFVLLFTSHFDYLSAFMLVGWERVGVVSSAETFIALAGIVTGLVFGRKMMKDGFSSCATRLVDRALQLYRINVFLILSIGLLRLAPWIDATAVTTFRDAYTGVTYPLYPSVDAGLLRLAGCALLLRCGPHQFQVIGLYVALFALTPLIFWMISIGRVRLLLALSWIVYLVNLATPESTPGTAQIRLTGAQFEYAFPLLAWQLLFVHGVAFGYYKQTVVGWLASKGRWLVWLAVVLSIAFLVFTLNHPIDSLPQWSRLSFIPPDTFNRLFNDWFLKYKLGPGRLLNEVVLFTAGYAAMTLWWRPIERAVGWFFIPLGQASLYVFFVHVYLILLVSNTPLPAMHNYWINTAIHAGTLLLVWWMVRSEFLFRWIPR